MDSFLIQILINYETENLQINMDTNIDENKDLIIGINCKSINRKR